VDRPGVFDATVGTIGHVLYREKPALLIRLAGFDRKLTFPEITKFSLWFFVIFAAIPS
jgi:hypothetical protein